MKLEKIKTQGMKAQTYYLPVKAIASISKCQLITSEESLVNKEHKFTTTIKQIPYSDVITPIKEAALKLPNI